MTQGCWAPSLSLVDNIKIYFINNAHYFNTRHYNIIKLLKVRLSRYFQGRHRCIGVMVLSIMIQQRVIVSDALYRHLSLSTHRCGALATSAALPHSSLFSILLFSTPAHFWLVDVSPLLHRRPSKTMIEYFKFFLHRIRWEYIAPCCCPTHFPRCTSSSGYPHPVLVDCCFLSSNGSHLRFMHHFLSIFLCLSIRCPKQGNEPWHHQTGQRTHCMES